MKTLANIGLWIIMEGKGMNMADVLWGFLGGLLTACLIFVLTYIVVFLNSKK